MSKLPLDFSHSGFVRFIEYLLSRSDGEIEHLFEVGLAGKSREDRLPPTGRNLRAFLERTRDEMRSELN